MESNFLPYAGQKFKIKQVWCQSYQQYEVRLFLFSFSEFVPNYRCRTDKENRICDSQSYVHL